MSLKSTQDSAIVQDRHILRDNTGECESGMTVGVGRRLGVKGKKEIRANDARTDATTSSGPRGGPSGVRVCGCTRVWVYTCVAAFTVEVEGGQLGGWERGWSVLAWPLIPRAWELPATLSGFKIRWPGG